MNPSNWTISQRMLVANGVVVATGFALLTVTPVTVSSSIRAAELLVLLLGAVAMLLANWLLMRKALRLAEERRQTARAVLAGQEGERLRVARELHDEVGQALIALLLKVERAGMQAPPALAPQLEEIAADLRFDLDEVRRIARELRPEMLEDLGLVNALIALTEAAGSADGPTIERDLSQRLPEISSEQELVVYRVAQEAINNALRHAQASHIAISLRSVRSKLLLLVRDNGHGLDPGLDSGGVGIQGMRERARLVGADLAVSSPPGGGVLVSLELPVGGA